MLATGLLAKLLRVDFVVSLMFMRLLLEENAIKATISSLEVIRGDDAGIQNLIDPSLAVLSGKGIDVDEFSLKNASSSQKATSSR